MVRQINLKPEKSPPLPLAAPLTGNNLKTHTENKKRDQVALIEAASGPPPAKVR